MPRVKRGVTSHQKHKKVFKLTKGYQFGRSKLVKQAKEALLHAGAYAFAGRKRHKRDMRRLWITQINAALTDQEISYSRFIAALKAKNINLDRKILAELAVHQSDAFKQIISQVR